MRCARSLSIVDLLFAIDDRAPAAGWVRPAENRSRTSFVPGSRRLLRSILFDGKIPEMRSSPPRGLERSVVRGRVARPEQRATWERHRLRGSLRRPRLAVGMTG